MRDNNLNDYLRTIYNFIIVEIIMFINLIRKKAINVQIIVFIINFV